jgi:hypothetical protein
MTDTKLKNKNIQTPVDTTLAKSKMKNQIENKVLEELNLQKVICTKVRAKVASKMDTVGTSGVTEITSKESGRMEYQTVMANKLWKTEQSK